MLTGGAGRALMRRSMGAVLAGVVAVLVVLAQPAVVEMPPLAQPAPGETVTDPAFGATITRLTDRGDGEGFGTHIYAQLQAFSPDSDYILLVEDGLYTVRRLDDLAAMPVDASGWNAPRWQPDEPHTLVHFDSNDDATVRVLHTHVTTGEESLVYTFPAAYAYVRPNQSFDELSRDGRWMAGMLTREDGESVIFALDLGGEPGAEPALGATLAISDLYAADCAPDPEWGVLEPDWIGMSPLGTYLVVQWVRDGTARCSGLESFDPVTGAFVGRAYEGHQHGDLGVTPDGEEFFMTFELASAEDPNRPGIGLRMLPGTETISEPRHLLTLDWADDGHISCQGPAGMCLVTYGGWPDDGWTPFERELFLLGTDGSIERLAHHRSSSCAYWVQPRASISADGRYVVFASDWGFGAAGFTCGGELGSGDAYLIERAVG